MIEIKGEKTILREPYKEDIDVLYYWQFEEEEQASREWNGPYIPEQHATKEEFYQSWEQQYYIMEGVPSSLVIEIDDTVVGAVGSYWVDPNTDWLETGIVIYDKHYWNGGYGSEAYQHWIDYLFEATGLHRLGLSTWSGNSRMIHVGEKVGMLEEARVREARKVDGEFFDAVKMGIMRSEWQKTRGKSPS
ncbi:MULTISPECIES: GNAT family N-acetyltransferase [Salimicrobium]|uniref:GNAT family N-acetyltransferase n=3 Tax=Salimicrobium TaxID=351195 RepID=K2FLX6_9BACI|nr:MULTISPECIES: GNAT family protein [Salimicrobium]AKG03501.1 GNAT family N-acetyltransferase [Salimicrobium jeotgali]EKE31986.1 putative acetyltransferase [Salimicrobium jeotgali]MBM7695952.1 RimJ/RimL family protein N-acetyltransferase [Salimicrobium jeotgali]SDX87936.1 Protein N-acetyltransferase, RimJ/RimL family [Salimicrobium album]SIS88970.1 Protein N-acetyltransferase, RimJ/RimL family [Salimicrobium salexigens]